MSLTTIIKFVIRKKCLINNLQYKNLRSQIFHPKTTLKYLKFSQFPTTEIVKQVRKEKLSNSIFLQLLLQCYNLQFIKKTEQYKSKLLIDCVKIVSELSNFSHFVKSHSLINITNAFIFKSITKYLINRYCDEN